MEQPAGAAAAAAADSSEHAPLLFVKAVDTGVIDVSPPAGLYCTALSVGQLSLLVQEHVSKLQDGRDAK